METKIKVSWVDRFGAKTTWIEIGLAEDGKWYWAYVCDPHKKVIPNAKDIHDAILYVCSHEVYWKSMSEEDKGECFQIIFERC